RHMYVPEVAKAIDKKSFVEPSELIKSMTTERQQQQQQEEERESTHQQQNTSSSSLPSLSSGDKLSSPFFSYSPDLQLRFVNDVLFPETIIRLIMNSDELSYEDADLKMTDGYEDLRWVETIMTSRNCFT